MSENVVGQHTSGVRFPPPFYYLIGLLIGFLIHWWLPVYLVTPLHRPMLDNPGVVLMVLGVSLFVWSVVVMHRAGTSPNPHVPTVALTMAGPYRFTRNPIYLAFVLVCAGFSLLVNLLWPLLSVLVVILIVDRRVIVKEERYLEAKFGDAYRQYKSRVRRWI
ncbi:MAG: isoprenylcysteine carboxylmethyltransferase family protein [Gammaproteobacteria bacterium]